jgi:hypothetical protein
MAAEVALDPDGAFSLFRNTSHIGGSGMALRKKDLEAENEELWQQLEDVYDRLGELFEPEGDDELDEDG